MELHRNQTTYRVSKLTFILSKVLWALLKPSHLIVLMITLGAVLSGPKSRGLGGILLTVGLISLVIIAVVPVSQWLFKPLEDRFDRPSELPSDISGIIVLGGAQSSDISLKRGSLALSGEAERLIEGHGLSLRYPNAKLVFSGGSASLLSDAPSEASVNERYVAMMQIDRSKVVLEGQSRNTLENAAFSKELLNPQKDENWILITSAYHMPRSVGIFRKQGWDVIPYPVDYQSTGEINFWIFPDLGQNLRNLDAAVREWIGLVAYHLMDRTDVLWPGPKP